MSSISKKRKKKKEAEYLSLHHEEGGPCMPRCSRLYGTEYENAALLKDSTITALLDESCRWNDAVAAKKVPACE